MRRQATTRDLDQVLSGMQRNGSDIAALLAVFFMTMAWLDALAGAAGSSALSGMLMGVFGVSSRPAAIFGLLLQIAMAVGAIVLFARSPWRAAFRSHLLAVLTHLTPAGQSADPTLARTRSLSRLISLSVVIVCSILFVTIVTQLASARADVAMSVAIAGVVAVIGTSWIGSAMIQHAISDRPTARGLGAAGVALMIGSLYAPAHVDLWGSAAISDFRYWELGFVVVALAIGMSSIIERYGEDGIVELTIGSIDQEPTYIERAIGAKVFARQVGLEIKANGAALVGLYRKRGVNEFRGFPAGDDQFVLPMHDRTLLLFNVSSSARLFRIQAAGRDSRKLVRAQVTFDATPTSMSRTMAASVAFSLDAVDFVKQRILSKEAPLKGELERSVAAIVETAMRDQPDIGAEIEQIRRRVDTKLSLATSVGRSQLGFEAARQRLQDTLQVAQQIEADVSTLDDRYTQFEKVRRTLVSHLTMEAILANVVARHLQDRADPDLIKEVVRITTLLCLTIHDVSVSNGEETMAALESLAKVRATVSARMHEIETQLSERSAAREATMTTLATHAMANPISSPVEVLDAMGRALSGSNDHLPLREPRPPMLGHEPSQDIEPN